MDYHFEEVQNLRVSVYDVDDKKHLDDLSRHDFIGEAKFTLGEVVAAGRVFTRQLTSASEYTAFLNLLENTIVLSNNYIYYSYIP